MIRESAASPQGKAIEMQKTQLLRPGDGGEGGVTSRWPSSPAPGLFQQDSHGRKEETKPALLSHELSRSQRWKKHRQSPRTHTRPFDNGWKTRSSPCRPPSTRPSAEQNLSSRLVLLLLSKDSEVTWHITSVARPFLRTILPNSQLQNSLHSNNNNKNKLGKQPLRSTFQSLFFMFLSVCLCLF